MTKLFFAPKANCLTAAHWRGTVGPAGGNGLNLHLLPVKGDVANFRKNRSRIQETPY